MPRRKVSPHQLSLFEQPPPSFFDAAPAEVEAAGPPTVDPGGGFILWYANVSGKGEHVYSRLPDGECGFAPREMIISGVALPLTYPYEAAKRIQAEHHARLGKMIQKANGYEIEEIWRGYGNEPG